MTPYYNDGNGIVIYHGRAEEVLPTLDESSIDMICVDPPYFKVKGEWWDHQWDTREGFVSWIGELCDQWQRVLKPNGSLYCFASPQMAWHVEGEIRKRFNVLNQIQWRKHDGTANEGGLWSRVDKEQKRQLHTQREVIIFAEHFGADNIAKGEAGYIAKCDELRGFVFEPLRAYLDSERERSGVSIRQVAEQYQKKTGSRTVTGMAGHWFGVVQWSLPTEENYEWLRVTLSGMNHSGEDLRREYEDLRRPFNVTVQDQYTDVWTFPTVATYQGKHACEKPADMMRQIMKTSGKPECTVLDCFAGSGSSLIAAKECGYNAIGVEACETWVQRCTRNVKRGYTVNQSTIKQLPSSPGQAVMF